jgi:hypothetical protein
MKGITLKAKAVLSRLTGFSVPIAGVSWTPPVDELDLARRLLVFLADRRALYQPYEQENENYVIRSVLEIRQRLTTDLENISSDSVLSQSLLAMRAACRQFLDETQDQRHNRHWHAHETVLYTSLGQLRTLFGFQIARLSVAFDLEVDSMLVSILPPSFDDSIDRSPSPSNDA